MSVTLSSNLAALSTLRHLSQAREDFHSSVEKLSSGRRDAGIHTNPSENAQASFAQAELQSTRQAMKNTQEASSLVQVTEGGLNEIHNLLMRLRELAVQGASSTLSDEEREILDVEREQLSAEIERIAQTTRIFQTPLLNGEGRELHFQIGTQNEDYSQISYDAKDIDVTSDSLGLDSIDLTDEDTSLDSLSTLDSALSQVNLARAKTGSLQTRLNSIASTLGTTAQTLTERVSRLRDTDLAEESTRLMQTQIRQQVSLALLAQANSNAQTLLRLLPS